MGRQGRRSIFTSEKTHHEPSISTHDSPSTQNHASSSGEMVDAAAKYLEGPTNEVKVDWTSFPLFPLNQIPFLTEEQLVRTRDELGRLEVSLQSSSDVGDRALLGYIKKEMGVISKQFHLLAASARVQEMLTNGNVRPIRELTFETFQEQKNTTDSIEHTALEEEEERLSGRDNVISAKKVVEERVESKNVVDDPELAKESSCVDSNEQENSHTRESNNNEESKPIRRKPSKPELAKYQKQISKVASKTWGKTFVVFSDSSKKRRKKQQEEERAKMLANAAALAKKKKAKELKQKKERQNLAAKRLREREEAREKWERERQERIAHAEKLAKELKERQKLEKHQEPTESDEKKKKRKRKQVIVDDEEEDEEQVALEEALDEERAANEDEMDKNLAIEAIEREGEAKEEADEEEGDEEEQEQEETEDPIVTADDGPKDIAKPVLEEREPHHHEPASILKESRSQVELTEQGLIAECNLEQPILEEDSIEEGKTFEAKEDDEEGESKTFEAKEDEEGQERKTLEANENNEEGKTFEANENEEKSKEDFQASERPETDETDEETEDKTVTDEDYESEDSGLCQGIPAIPDLQAPSSQPKSIKEEVDEARDCEQSAHISQEVAAKELLDRIKQEMTAIQEDITSDLLSFKDDMDKVENELETEDNDDDDDDHDHAGIHCNEEKGKEEVLPQPKLEAKLHEKDDDKASISSSSSSSSSEDDDDDDEEAGEVEYDFNSPGAIDNVIQNRMKGKVVDYSDLFSSFYEIMTLWHTSTSTRKTNRIKALEECMENLMRTYGSCNRVLAMYACDNMPSSDKLALVQTWRDVSHERFYRVLARSRDEVYNIVKESCTNLDSIGVEEGSLVAKLKQETAAALDGNKAGGTKKKYPLTSKSPMVETPEGVGSIWNLLWTWSKPKVNRDTLLVWQRVNHFHNARSLTRKDLLKKELHKYRSMSQYLANEFELLPDTFILPKEYLQFVDAFSKYDETTPNWNYWIMKPVGLSRGRGISLVSDIGDVCYGQSVIIQRYLGNPLLLDGYKFDLRIYVLVTSFQPLEAFVYDEGFVRVCTHKYSSNAMDLKNLFIHLTNSSIQKLGPNGAGTKATAESISRHKAELHEAGGTKLSLGYLWRRLRQQGLDVEQIKFDINTLILKSLVCCDEGMTNQPNSFELFGYDVLIDDNLRPWLIEINSSPSLAQENHLDTKIKRKLIADSLRLVDPVPFDRAALLEVLQKRLQDLQQNRLRPFQQTDQKETEVERLNRELTAIFHGRRPRAIGEMPQDMGGYERICPGGKYHDHVKKILRQDRIKTKKSSTNRSTSTKYSSVIGKGGLQYLAEGCNIKL